MNNSSPWRTVLSVAVCLFAIIRLAITCSNSSRRSDMSANDVNALLERSNEFRARDSNLYSGSNSLSNDLFYESYDSIKKLDNDQMAVFRISEVKKDTLLPLDITSKVNIQPKSFIQKNYDDSLQLAVKLPDNTSIFLHSYDSSDDMLDNFKSIKRKKDIQNLKTKVDDSNSKFVSYNYQFKGKKYNGYALLAKENGQFTALEFENNKISKEELESKVFTFIAQISK